MVACVSAKMSTYFAVKNRPWPRSQVSSLALSGERHKLTSPEADGFWATFEPSTDGTMVSIRSFIGTYEDECHGEFYPVAVARAYYKQLLEAAFIKSKEPL